MSDIKPTHFYIYLNSNQDTFFVGYPITGFVIVEVTKPKRTRFIQIRLVGTAKTHWTETETYTNEKNETKTRTVSYSDNAKIIDETLNLWTPPPGAGVLLPGRYSFPFSFTIPVNSATPPTFKAEHGEIKYYLTAELDRPGVRFNHRTYRPITMIDFVDTNMPQYLNEVSTLQTKTMCCLCCKSKPINLSARIPASAWCPGEIVPVEVTVENGSNKQMNGIIAAIDRSVTFKARSRSKYINDRLTSVKLDDHIDPESKLVQTLYLRVPPCCPSFGMHSGRIIELSYVLKVTLRLPAGSFNLHAKLPIVVGSIPHAFPPFFRDMYEAAAAAAAGPREPEYTWCTPEAIAGAAAGGAPPASPDALPPPPDFIDFESEDPEPQNMEANINYVYFPMPNQYSAYTQQQGNVQPMRGEQTPLLGSGGGGAYQQQVAPSAPPPPPTGVNFSATAGGFSGNIFSAPSAFVPIPDENAK